MEHFGTFWNILEHFGTFWNFWNILETFWNILEHSAGFSNNLGHVEQCGPVWDFGDFLEPFVRFGTTWDKCETICENL